MTTGFSIPRLESRDAPAGGDAFSKRLDALLLAVRPQPRFRAAGASPANGARRAHLDDDSSDRHAADKERADKQLALLIRAWPELPRDVRQSLFDLVSAIRAADLSD